MLLPPIKRLTDITSVIQRGLAAAEVVFSLIDEPTERASTNHKITWKEAGEIKFDNVSFSYPGSDTRVLHHFSLHIPPGQVVALVGKSGSGKSTVTSLLSGFYCLKEGDIFLDNHSFKDLSLQEIRSNITLVSQDIRLFNDTVLHNVAYGDEDPNLERVNKALIHAHALEFVNNLPDKTNTLIGQNGVKLSGGQRQRLSIARAFYKGSSILILDEATSSLDTESERNIQKALDELMKGRTTIIVAHRLSTIEKSDRIIVMDEGGIAEYGTHTQLMGRDGLYSHYYKLQFSD